MNALTPVFPAMHARRRLRAVVVTLALSMQAGVAMGDSPAAAVGQVSFVIGSVQAVDAQGEARTLEGGAAVLAGDRIETAAGQHVHLRFVDGGFVSVRPGSRLIVERYDVTGSETAIRFRLDRGVVRSITGQAAQVRKDRFRLNTPVAAIGVRGTDFVVHADDGSLRAVVNQGAIVVAPFGDACQIDALGPCGGADARELSDAMGRVLLEMSAAQPARIVPLNGQGPDQANPPAAEELPHGGMLLPAVEALGASQSANSGNSGNSGRPSLPLDPVALPKLQWGRWGDARPGDSFSPTAASAAQGRTVTVGNAYASLFRMPGDSPSLSRRLPSGNFSLSRAEAVFTPHGGAQAVAAVSGGWLQIDFSRRQFGTGLTLSHALTGDVALSAKGKVRDDGVFATNSNGTRVAGAVSFDGSEAGYLFDKHTVRGVFNGTTLWGR